MKTIAYYGKWFSDFVSIIGQLYMWKSFEERFIVYSELRSLERIIFWYGKLNTLWRCGVIKVYFYIGIRGCVLLFCYCYLDFVVYSA